MSKFISKERYGMAMIVIMVLFFNLLIFPQANQKGRDFLRDAQEVNVEKDGDGKQRRLYESAYKEFMNSTQKNDILLKIYIGSLIHKENQIRPIAANFVKEYRDQYPMIIRDLQELNENEKQVLENYIRGIEEQFPFIEKIKLVTDSISPYSDEKPIILFSLNTPANVEFNVEDYSECNQSFSGGPSTLSFSWQRHYMDKQSLRLTLNAKNELSEFSVEKKVLVNLILPSRLSYYNGDYSLEGESIKSETKIVTRKNFGVLLGGLALSAVLGGVIYGVKENTETGTIYTPQERKSNGLKAGGVGAALTLLYFFAFSKKKTIPHQGNIDYNRQLRAQIEALRKQVKVNLKIENEE